MPRPASRWLTVASVALLATGVLALYVHQRHTGLFENGAVLMELWRRGIVVHTHALTLPLAHLAAWLGLAGSPPARDLAVSLVSAAGATLAVTAIVGRAVAWSGVFPALLAGLLAALAPALRFHAGAVETRALACGGAALAGVLAATAARSRGRALALTAGGFALACACHATLVLLGPALLLLHADAETRAGRAPTARGLVGAGLALAAGALSTAGAILLADRIWNPPPVEESSMVLRYLGVAADWGAAFGRPRALTWFVTEVAGPLGALLTLALVGIVPLLREAPRRAAALLVWILSVTAAAFWIGSRQYGGYLLPALPPLAWLAAAGLRRLSAAGRVGPAALALLALLAMPAGVLAWHRAGGDWADSAAGLPPWPVTLEDLATPWSAQPDVMARLGAALWLAAGALLALLAGVLASSNGQPVSRGTAAPAAAVALAALALQWSGGESFRPRWPALWGQEIRDYCESANVALGQGDLLVTITPSAQVAWQFEHYLRCRWIDLANEPALDDRPRVDDWIRGLEQELARTRASGGIARLAREGLAVLEVQRDRHPIARGLTKRWLNEGRVVLWSRQPVPSADEVQTGR